MAAIHCTGEAMKAPSVHYGRLKRIPGAVVYAALALAVILALLPLYALVTSAFNPGCTWAGGVPGLWPARWDASAFSSMWSELGGGIAFANGLLVAAGATVAGLPICMLAGYTLARGRFFGSRLLYKSLIVTAALPPVAYAIVILRSAAALGLQDTSLVVLLWMMTQPLAILALRAYIRKLPQDMLDAARLDGLSDIGILRAIVLPHMRRGLIAVAVLQFVVTWNALTVPMVLVASPEKQTLTVLAAQLARTPWLPWPQVTSAALLSVLPVLAAFLLTHRLLLAEAANWAEGREWTEDPASDSEV